MNLLGTLLGRETSESSVPRAHGTKVVGTINDTSLEKGRFDSVTRENADAMFTGRHDPTIADALSTVNRIAKACPEYGVHIHDKLSAVKRMSSLLDQKSQDAIEYLLDAFERSAQGLPGVAKTGTLDGVEYTNPKKALQAALRILNEYYERDVEFVGTITGTDREHWDIIEAPGIKTINGNWSRRRANSQDQIGNFEVTQEGYQLCDTVKNVYHSEENPREFQTGIVVRASHTFGALGQGTRTIEVYEPESGKTHIVTPWSLKKAS